MHSSYHESVSKLSSPNCDPQGDRDRDKRRSRLVPRATRWRRTHRSRKFDGLLVGRLVGFDVWSTPMIDYPENRSGQPLPARSTVSLSEAQIGEEVALMFDGGDPRRPVVMGAIQTSVATSTELRATLPTPVEAPRSAEVDGKRVVVTAADEIVLRCGEASITLTRVGKVLIRGAFVSSRSSGVNRISGGSVQIN